MAAKAMIYVAWKGVLRGQETMSYGFCGFHLYFSEVVELP